MKKTLFVAALAAVLVFAFAASAFAAIGSPNDFETWDTGIAGNGTTPHMGFTASTVKCAVCHSVHNADVSSAAPYGSDPGAQNILLATSAANACIYCHVSVGSVSSKRPYGTDATFYTGASVFNHSSAPENSGLTYAGCTTCHSVHGANTWGGAVATSILTKGTLDTPSTWGGSATAGEALSAFCSQCHAYYEAGYDTMSPATLGDHVMTSDTTGYNNHEAKSAVQGVVVAYTASTYCTSCHNRDDAAGAFPHYTSGYARFMTGGANSGAANGTLANPSMDGACLKCHVNAAGSGVNNHF